MVGVKSWLAMMVVGILVLVVGACTSAGSPSPTPTAHGDEKALAPNTPAEPVLSGALIRGCPPTTRPGGGFAAVGLSEEEKAVDFKLQDVHGNEFVLSQLLAEKPVVMVFGSFT
jgi:cytochrome oxidase Cu insertion factor (SCO1/SenC/PrrC family)